MLDLNILTYEFVKAKPLFATVAPGPLSPLKGKVARYATRGLTAWGIGKITKKVWTGEKTVSEATGEFIGNKAIGKIVAKPKEEFLELHHHVRQIPRRDMFRKNGLGGRYWIHRTGNYPLVVVFHDADRAGPHLDIHLGRFSMIRRVKPHIYEQLKYNHTGRLTKDSSELLMNFLREEIDNNSRIPQNLDHTITNAKMEWLYDETKSGRYGDNEFSYGSGRTRQVIVDSTATVYKANEDGPIEFYAPAINAHRGMYVYKLYNGNSNRAPILIWGNLKSHPPKLEDRLHLSLIQPSSLKTLHDKVDMETSTAKYDGSSCYVVITEKGTTVWSPRKSVRTGEQIEYTAKIGGLPEVTSDNGVIIAMGELLFKENSILPLKDDYLPQPVGSGILNSNLVVPSGVKPEIRLYRVDKMSGNKTVNLPFWENRKLQETVAQMYPDILKVVELMDPSEAQAKGYEGVVLVPEGQSVNAGYKTKWWRDADDWRIDSVQYTQGPKGRVAGVTICTSLESGKIFKLGPGQMGNEDLTRDMMANPENYIGRVLKVHSRHGHEGRAAKVHSFHDDKGVA